MDAESGNKLAEYEAEIQILKTAKTAAAQTVVQLTAEIADMKKSYKDFELLKNQEYEDLSRIKEKNESDLCNRNSELNHTDGTITRLEAQVLGLQKQIAEHMDVEPDTLPQGAVTPGPQQQANPAPYISFEGNGTKPNSEGLDPIYFKKSLSNLRPDTLPEGAVTPGLQQAPQQANPAPHVSFEGKGIEWTSREIDPIDFKKSLSNLRPHTLPEGAVTPGPQQAPQQANPAPHVSFEGKGIEWTSREIDPIDFKKSLSNLRPHTLPEGAVTPGLQQAPQQANPAPHVSFEGKGIEWTSREIDPIDFKKSLSNLRPHTLPEGAVTPGPQQAPQQANPAPHVSFEGKGIEWTSREIDPIDFKKSLSNLRPDTLPEGAVTPGLQQAPQQANPAPHVSFEGKGIEWTSREIDPIDFKKSLSNLRPHTLPEGAVTPGLQQAPQQANPAPHVSFEGKGIEWTSREIDPIDFKKSLSNLRPHTLPEGAVTPGPQQAPQQANPAPHVSFEGKGIEWTSREIDPIDFKRASPIFGSVLSTSPRLRLTDLETKPDTLPEGAVTPGLQQAPQQANPAPHVSFEGKGIEWTSREIDPIDFKKSLSNLRPHTLPEGAVTPGPQQAPQQANPAPHVSFEGKGIEWTSQEIDPIDFEKSLSNLRPDTLPEGAVTPGPQQAPQQANPAPHVSFEGKGIEWTSQEIDPIDFKKSLSNLRPHTLPEAVVTLGASQAPEQANLAPKPEANTEAVAPLPARLESHQLPQETVRPSWPPTAPFKFVYIRTAYEGKAKERIDELEAEVYRYKEMLQPGAANYVHNPSFRTTLVEFFFRPARRTYASKQALETTVEDAENSIKSWEAAYEGVDAKLVSLQSQIHSLEEENSRLKVNEPERAQMLVGLVGEVERLQHAVTSLDTSKQALETTVEDAENSIKSWDAAYKGVDAKLVSLQSQIHSLEEENSRLKVNEPERAQMPAGLVGEVERLQQAVTSLDASKQALETTVEDAENSIKSWEAAYKGVDTKLVSLQSQNDQQILLMAALEEEKSDLAAQVVSLQESHNQSEIWRAKTSELETSNDTLAIAVKLAAAEEARHLQQIGALGEQIDELQSQIDEVERENAELQASLEEGNDESDVALAEALQKELDDSKAVCHKLEQDLLAAQTSASNLEILNSELETARDKAEDDQENLIKKEVAARLEDLRKKWETEDVEKHPMFEQKVAAAAEERSKSLIRCQLAQHKTIKENLEKRETDMETKFRMRTKEMDDYKRFNERRIQNYEDQAKIMLKYIAEQNAALLAAETERDKSRQGGGDTDIDMPDIANERFERERRPQLGSSSAKPNPAPTSLQGERPLPRTQGISPQTQASSGQTPFTPPRHGSYSRQSSAPKANSANKTKVATPRKPKAKRPPPQRDALTAFRRFVQKQLGISKDNQIDQLIIHRATLDVLAAFDSQGIAPIPNGKGLYALDVEDDVTKSDWNVAVGESLIIAFFAGDEGSGFASTVDESFLRPLWMDRLNASDPEYMAKLSQSARKLTHRSHLFSRRQRSGQLTFSRTVQRMFAVLFDSLNGQVMSSDDEIGTERRKKTCRVIRKDWRSEVLINLLKWLDYNADHESLTASGVSVGPGPHPRIRSTIGPATKFSLSPAMSGLPSNLYSPLFLAGLSAADHDKLNPQNAIPLPVEVFNLQTNENFDVNRDDQDEYWKPQRPSQGV
ncbi:hypothetical protein DFH06DRAFT_1327632 [Mycena polygramma]|nr:hypothetical protein DFH06DRAFT_1327632 [Mycena polygramma]